MINTDKTVTVSNNRERQLYSMKLSSNIAESRLFEFGRNGNYLYCSENDSDNSHEYKVCYLLIIGFIGLIKLIN